MKIIFLLLDLISCGVGLAQTKKTTKKMNKKVLFVVTSHTQLGNTGQKTGYYSGEVTHPLEEIEKAGYTVDFVSPLGGATEAYGINMNDPVDKKYWENADFKKKLAHTKKPSEVKAKDYVAIFYAGGHGTMWDFADNKALAQLAAQIYEQNGVVAAVCHGPAGLVNIKLSNDKYLVEGKKVSAFTNEEEQAVKLDKVVPFSLEDQLKERGAFIEKSGMWQDKISVDNRLITGQNPQSAKSVGEAIVKELSTLQDGKK